MTMTELIARGTAGEFAVQIFLDPHDGGVNLSATRNSGQHYTTTRILTIENLEVLALVVQDAINKLTHDPDEKVVHFNTPKVPELGPAPCGVMMRGKWYTYNPELVTCERCKLTHDFSYYKNSTFNKGGD